ncbi:GTPase Era [Gynuella sunshinyii]|uniref:GTPase Era n=1 Tax=Gynuella sunshinyii YC6258 TaxID=1445510 RepID=A0A0C5VJS7_9GAMM|nr:GTPase Era [Gynuella sunshinyii]AJQ94541.1 GTPase [Gynuella sunshinyii YC6258]
MNDHPDSSSATHCGYVAIVGRPNVGKSTLMNHILGQKISITSRKPQTTRNQIIGIHTVDSVQIIFVDTPGIHQGQPKAINRYMNRTATTAIKDVDVILFLVERDRWTPEDEHVLEQLKSSRCPVILGINKMDQLEDKAQLLPFIEKVSTFFQFDQVFPISALRGNNLHRLERYLLDHMPVNVHYYPEDQITDRTERFLAAEIVREKIMRQLGAELPYDVAVEIENWSFENGTLHIHAAILVSRAGQKKIVIGDKGSRLKSIGQEARKDMEKLFDVRIMLHLWVKVKGGWSDDDRALKSLGYFDPK